jgi:hypothetical protein
LLITIAFPVALRAVKCNGRHSISAAADADGNVHHWQAEFVPNWSSGEVAGFYALYVDITQRKIAETVMKLPGRYAALQEASEIPIFR